MKKNNEYCVIRNSIKNDRIVTKDTLYKKKVIFRLDS